jgi:hypothetical protein
MGVRPSGEGPPFPQKETLGMKCTSRIVAVVALGCLLGRAGEAAAQYPPGTPYAQPQLSPYLNVLRGGASPGTNYFTLVRPQLNNQAGIAGLQQQTQLNQALITGLATGGTAGMTGPVTTGQPFGFQTQLAFFQNQFRFGQMAGGFPGGGVGGAATGGPAGFGVLGTGGAGPAGAGGGPARGPGGGGAPRGR